MDEGKVIDVVYLDFSKASDTISHRILLENRLAMAWTGVQLAG